MSYIVVVNPIILSARFADGSRLTSIRSNWSSFDILFLEKRIDSKECFTSDFNSS
jgi:hypothetical protein